MTNLFDQTYDQAGFRPLADRMRPGNLSEFIGQHHLLTKGMPLWRALAQGHLHSMVLWGPPGVGKTTLARIMAKQGSAQFITLSAVLAGIKDIRDAVAKAQEVRATTPTVLFVDEVHRFNKSQQDAFLPYVEDGTLFLVGATTENPSFELNNALLSRVRTYVLKPLMEEDIEQVMQQALRDRRRGLGQYQLVLPERSARLLVVAADGDARRVLNLLELAADMAQPDTNDRRVMTEDIVREMTSQTLRRFDKGGEYFYDQISALHKSLRGSNPDAALYWFCRMLDGGCDPLYIARRLVRFANEDVGNADPRALELALNAWESFIRMGSPEGELALAQAVVYLAAAPKSNAVYVAFKEAMHAARKYGSLEVPLHLRNAPTHLMKSLDYGKGYRYVHNEPDAYAVGEQYFPQDMSPETFYRPTDHGLEARIRVRLDELRKL